MSQLYFVEFFIDRLNLTEQIIKDAGETAVFEIKINFIDFPTFQITRQNLTSAKVNPLEIKSRLEFKAGQAAHFTIEPKKLVQKMTRRPFSIKIFRKDDSFPLCLAELPLSGCLCDQAKMSIDDFSVPKPYLFGGRISLVDIGGNLSGNVDVTLRMTCYGRYVVTSYVLDKGCFFFKNDPQGAEFKVEQLPEENEKNINLKEAKDEFRPELDITGRQLPWENFMRDVAVIFPSAGRLAVGKPPPKPQRVPLALPEYVEAPLKTGKAKKGKKRRKKNK